MTIVIHSPETKRLKLYTPSKVYNFEKRGPNITSWLEGDDVIVVKSLSSMSKTQLAEWLDLSSWFERFSPVSNSIGIDMSIIFYDAEHNLVRVCDPEKGISTHKFGNQKLIEKLPERIAFVEKVDIMRKNQFAQWLQGTWKPPEQAATQSKPKPTKNKRYLHTVHDGTVLIEDIEIDGEPLRLSGKWNFVPVDKIGEERLYSSYHYQVLIKKGKIEIVDEAYVEANKHKYKKSPSISSGLPVGSVDDFFKEEDSNTITINL